MPEQHFDADPVPGTPIGDMKAWQLHIQCARCRQPVVLRFDYLAEQHGRQISVIEVIRRLRCTRFRGSDRCRGRPKLVTLVKVSTYGKTTRKLREIIVLGASNPWSLPPLASRPD
jgi:hypothetical protein